MAHATLVALRDATPDLRRTAAVAVGATGAAIAIAVMELLADRSAIPLLFVPFATSIVLVMGSPQTAAAQPRALIGGHLVSTMIGLLVVKVAGPGITAAALAVGLAILAMHLTRSFHPPAGIDPLVVVVNDEGFNVVADQDQQPIPKKGTEYDFEKLGTELKKLKDAHPDKGDVQVASEDQIKFEVLVRTMDTALTSRFPDISLIDAGGAGI